MTTESRRIAGVLLLTLVGVEFGGYYLTRVVTGQEELTPFQESFARAGHGHAGVLLLLALICLLLADVARMSGVRGRLTRLAVPAAAVLMSAGFFLSSLGSGLTAPNGLVVVLIIGAVSLGLGVISLGLALLRSTAEVTPVGGDGAGDAR
ncbi:MAG TPA: hypothetical protein VMM13_15265 [Euzebya sp.]|nr:hypothetical protein [Euzebya sp.]